MIPASKIKEIRKSINSWNVGGDCEGIPPIKPILTTLLIIGGLFLLILLTK